MKITIFAKKRNTESGKVFFNYITTMRRKDGEDIVATVKFRDECGQPKPETCPLNIEFDKKHANLAPRKYFDEEGNEKTAWTLWLSAWKNSDDVYVDHSLDDFE